ncbi:hypothetical protein AYI68_g5065 [Smittium mucronatum]|uniref:DUF4211 domain-containing protein n=1 Tax=Smittium mucronatum TaxID=133383 RepID=A0A1R0GV96_9FUNG|nr:hypothetical protein AYI68_g5065 [Smittium mucronatum]
MLSTYSNKNQSRRVSERELISLLDDLKPEINSNLGSKNVPYLLSQTNGNYFSMSTRSNPSSERVSSRRVSTRSNPSYKITSPSSNSSQIKPNSEYSANGSPNNELSLNETKKELYVFIENVDKSSYESFVEIQLNKSSKKVFIDLESSPKILNSSVSFSEFSKSTISPIHKSAFQYKKRSNISYPKNPISKFAKPNTQIVENVSHELVHLVENTKKHNRELKFTTYDHPPENVIEILITKNSFTSKMCRIVSRAISLKLQKRDLENSLNNNALRKNQNNIYNRFNSSPIRKKNNIIIHESSSEDSENPVFNHSSIQNHRFVSSSPIVAPNESRNKNFLNSKYIGHTNNNIPRKDVKIFESDNDSSEIEDGSIYEDRTFTSQFNHFGFERKINTSQSHQLLSRESPQKPISYESDSDSFKLDSLTQVNTSTQNFENPIIHNKRIDTGIHSNSEPEPEEVSPILVKNSQLLSKVEVINLSSDNGKDTQSDDSQVIKKRRFIGRRNSIDKSSPGSVSPRSIVMKYKLQKELKDLEVSRGYSVALDRNIKKKFKKPSYREVLIKSRSQISNKTSRTSKLFYNHSSVSDSDDSDDSYESSDSNIETSYSDVINYGLPRTQPTSSSRNRPGYNKKSRSQSYRSSANHHNSMNGGRHSNSQMSMTPTTIDGMFNPSVHDSDGISRPNSPSSRSSSSVYSSDFVVDEDEVVDYSGNDGSFYKAIDNIEISSQSLPAIRNRDLLSESNSKEIRLSDFGLSFSQDIHTSFNTYIQYMIHAIFNRDIVNTVDFETMKYFENAKNTVDNRISTIRDSLVSSSVWNPQFLIDLKSHPIYELEDEDPIAGCEACTFGTSRTSTFSIHLMGYPSLNEVPKFFSTVDEKNYKPGRNDLVSIRFKKFKTYPKYLMDRNLVTSEMRSFFKDGYDTTKKVGDLHTLGISGVSYLSGRFCQKRSQVYHWLYHYPYYLFLKLKSAANEYISKQKIDLESKFLFINTQCSFLFKAKLTINSLFPLLHFFQIALNPKEKAKFAEGMVYELEKSKVTAYYFKEFTKYLDDAQDLYSTK